MSRGVPKGGPILMQGTLLENFCVHACMLHTYTCTCVSFTSPPIFLFFPFSLSFHPLKGLLVKRSQGKSGALGRTNWKDRWFTVDGMYCSTQSLSVRGGRSGQSVWRRWASYVIASNVPISRTSVPCTYHCDPAVRWCTRPHRRLCRRWLWSFPDTS